MKKKFGIMLLFLLTFSFLGPVAQAFNPGQFISSISNIQFDVNPYDVGTGKPLTISYDYNNFDTTTQSFTVSIYKAGDASMTDLFKNYYVGGATRKGDTTPSSAGTNSYFWYAMSGPQAFLDPGTYVFQVSGVSGTTTVGPVTKPFTVTNTGNVQPSGIYSVSLSSNPYNPNQGPEIFSYTIDDLTTVGTSALVNLSLKIGKKVNNQWASLNYDTKGQSSTWTKDSINWDGKDQTTNQFVPDGTYDYDLTGNNGSFGYTTSGTFVVKSTAVPPSPSPTPNPPPPTPSPNPPPATHCAGFIDIAASDANCNVYSWVKSAGIFTGNPDGSFVPQGFLQRDQIAKVVLEAFGKYKAGTEYCQAGNPFSDVTVTEWAREYICLGKQTVVNGQALLTGYQSGPNAGLFLPGNSVNRSEFLAMVLRNLKESMPSADTASYSDVALNQWDSSYAAYAAQYLSSIYPQPTLNRSQLVTRLEAARVLFALHNQGSL